jgi:hypothetical protein
MPDDPQRPSEFANEDHHVPSYGKPELQRALIAARAHEASGEKRVAELEAQDADVATDDRLRVALADLAVQRRFIAALEACESTNRHCPPRLDDPPWAFDPDPDNTSAPPLTAALRFDVDSWRVVATELHGRACACRTIACVDSLGVAIEKLELRPMPEVQGDEVATVSITRARECLFRLRGKTRRR